MQIQLSPQIESIVKELLATGDYHDQDEVITAAIILLEDERKLRSLRASLAEAEDEIAAGDYVVWTPELRAELQHEARQMVNEGRKPNPDVCP
jgi:putative addiction module CopG family antidote